MNKKILITGCSGQIGQELIYSFLKKKKNIIGLDLINKTNYSKLKFYNCDILDKEKLNYIFENENFTEVYHLAAYLSAKAENNINKAWEINMDGLMNILELCKKYSVTKIFWPSSIAVFGKDAKKWPLPQPKSNQLPLNFTIILILAYISLILMISFSKKEVLYDA